MKKISLFICLISISLHTLSEDVPGAKLALLDYYEATKTYNTTAIANSMNPEALSRFRSTINAALLGNKSELAKKELLPLFTVSQLDEFMKLSDMEAYKRLNDFIASSQPDLIKLLKSSDIDIVSEIKKDDVVYITYTLIMYVEGRKVSKDIVQKLKQYNGLWLLLLPPNGEATIAGIESRYK